MIDQSKNINFITLEFEQNGENIHASLVNHISTPGSMKQVEEPSKMDGDSYRILVYSSKNIVYETIISNPFLKALEYFSEDGTINSHQVKSENGIINIRFNSYQPVTSLSIQNSQGEVIQTIKL